MSKKLLLVNKLNEDEIFHFIVKNYKILSRKWINHQWNWMELSFSFFKDHTKSLVLEVILKEILKSYSQNKIFYQFDEFFNNSNLIIDAFTIRKISENLDDLYLPWCRTLLAEAAHRPTASNPWLPLSTPQPRSRLRVARQR